MEGKVLEFNLHSGDGVILVIPFIWHLFTVPSCMAVVAEHIHNPI